MVTTINESDVSSIEGKKFDCIILNTSFEVNDLSDTSVVTWTDRKVLKTMSLIEKSTQMLSNGGLLYIYGLPKYLSFFAEFLNTYKWEEFYCLFKYWIGIEFQKEEIGQPLPNSHLGLLMYLKTKSLKNPTPFKLRTKIERIPHRNCMACEKNVKDWGGKRHLMNPLGTAVSDVWSDLDLQLKEGAIIPTEVVGRIVNLQAETKRDVLLLHQQSSDKNIEEEIKDSVEVFASQKKKMVDEISHRIYPIEEPNKDFDFQNEVVHGDCIEFMNQVHAQHPNGIFDLTFADPPYNLAKDYKVYQDDLAEQKYIEWCNEWLMGMYKTLKPGGALLVLNIPKWAVYHYSFLADKMHFQHWIIWDALSTPSGKFLPAHYSLLYFTKPGASPKVNLAESKFIDSREYCLRASCIKKRKKIGDDKKEVITDIWKDIHRIKHKKDRDNHPCQLPTKLMDRVIQLFTNEGDWVFDPFGGAGTAAISAKMNHRNFTITDLDEHYYKIAKRNLGNLVEDMFGNITLQRASTVKKAKGSSIDRQIEMAYITLCQKQGKVIELKNVEPLDPTIYKQLLSYNKDFKYLKKITRRQLENVSLLEQTSIE